MDFKSEILQQDFTGLLEKAVREDLGDAGDITSSVIFQDHKDTVSLYSRQDGVLSGLDFALSCFPYITPTAEFALHRFASDGDRITDGQQIVAIEGPVASILRAERIALNFLGFFSGIASITAVHVAALGNSKTRLLDTRKTLPGFRRLSKAAVLDGGGNNHRMGLYDMVMIKDNHIDAAGSARAAVESIRKAWGTQYRVELECRNLDEVRQALDLDVNVIMLDNMSYDECSQALELRSAAGRSESIAFEASGDFTPERLKEYADLNLDFISVGGLTHSVSNHNFSLRFPDEPISSARSI